MLIPTAGGELQFKVKLKSSEQAKIRMWQYDENGAIAKPSVTVKEEANAYAASYEWKAGATTIDSKSNATANTNITTATKQLNNGESVLQFTNKPEEHSVTVTKAVESDDTAERSARYQFTATFSNLLPNKAYKFGADNVTANAQGVGTVSFTLSDGEQRNFTNVPEGTKVVVKENANELKANYTVTQTGQQTITNGNSEPNQALETPQVTVNDNVTAAFTNVSDARYSLTVTKNVKGDLGDRTKEFEFVATFTGLKPNATYDGFKSDPSGGATVNFKLKDDEQKVFEELPKSAKVVIREKASNHVPSYVIDSGNAVNGTKATLLDTSSIAMTDNHTVAFTNTRNIEPVTARMEHSIPYVAIALLTALAIFILRRKNVADEE